MSSFHCNCCTLDCRDLCLRAPCRLVTKPGHVCNAANVGVPVSEMNDAYTKESATLSEAIIAYGTLDTYDPARVQVVNVSFVGLLMSSSSLCVYLFQLTLEHFSQCLIHCPCGMF